MRLFSAALVFGSVVVLAAKMAVAEPPASSPSFTQDAYSGGNAFTINESMDQAGFNAFCAAHANTDTLTIDHAETITSLAPLAKLTKLENLTLRNMTTAEKKNRIDLTPLAQLASLTMLDCQATCVSNTGALKNLKKLKTIIFYMSEVDSIECVKDLPALENLNLYGDHTFANYEPLAATKLKSLNVYMNKQATDANLKALAKIHTLEEFSADLTPSFSNIEFLRNQPNLRKVELWNDPIADISPLAGKPQLESVTLWGTKVTNLAALAKATELTFLDLSDTAITDISPLFALKKLRTVRLPATVPASQVATLKAANPAARIDVQQPAKK